MTALSEAHGGAAVGALDAFTAAAVAVVANTGAELVTTIGDAVILAALTPTVEPDAVRRVFEECYAIGAFPEPRGGLHHGPVVARDGDHMGATADLAARLASRASGGQALATEPVAQAARDVVELGADPLRDIREPVDLRAVELCPTPVAVLIDPVCRKRVSCHTAVARVRHASSEHRLCPLRRLRVFAAEPDRYLTTERTLQP